MKYIVEDKVSEMSYLANDIMAKLYQEDPRGKLLYLFITKLIAISKLTAYGIDDENKLYVVTKTEYDKLKDSNVTKKDSDQTIVDNRAFEKNYNIEWFTGKGKIATTSAVLTAIKDGYTFFRYPSGGIFMLKDEAIRSLECLE